MNSSGPFELLQESRIFINDLEFYTITLDVPNGVEKRGRFVFIHGFAETVKYQLRLFSFLARLGFEVFSFDQRGSGYTSEKKDERGRTTDELTFKDLDCFLEYHIERTKLDLELPWFLGGHSMGGGIVLTYMIKGTYREMFAGYIAMSPLVLLHKRTRPSPLLYYPLVGLSRLIPQFQFYSGLEVDYLSHDAAHIEFVRNEPIYHATGSLKLLHNMIVRGTELLKSKNYQQAIDRPVLILHGDDDQINSFEASKELLDNLINSDKTFIAVHGGYHELMKESPKFSKVFYEALELWLLQHTA
ncbi:Alpha/Beta hydrolase protein [Dipodascopsis tothii]|uniref:Alpha/Beta hydrolase protein n=1 Tax=Dipodascopsis tothii TaxID=44089 RepID=UPI0034CFFEFB